jgi:hypothetical protein
LTTLLEEARAQPQDTEMEIESLRSAAFDSLKQAANDGRLTTLLEEARAQPQAANDGHLTTLLEEARAQPQDAEIAKLDYSDDSSSDGSSTDLESDTDADEDSIPTASVLTSAPSSSDAVQMPQPASNASPMESQTPIRAEEIPSSIKKPAVSPSTAELRLLPQGSPMNLVRSRSNTNRAVPMICRMDLDDASDVEPGSAERSSSLARNYNLLDAQIHCLSSPRECADSTKMPEKITSSQNISRATSAMSLDLDGDYMPSTRRAQTSSWAAGSLVRLSREGSAGKLGAPRRLPSLVTRQSSSGTIAWSMQMGKSTSKFERNSLRQHPVF